jgi:hypothetical protein
MTWQPMLAMANHDVAIMIDTQTDSSNFNRWLALFRPTTVLFD